MAKMFTVPIVLRQQVFLENLMDHVLVMPERCATLWICGSLILGTVFLLHFSRF